MSDEPRLDNLQMRLPSELDGDDLIRIEQADMGWRMGHTRPRNLEDIETQWGADEQNWRLGKGRARLGRST